jgi:putative membrane protein
MTVFAMNGDATMHQRLSRFLILCFIALTQPLQAVAQQQSQAPEWFLFGPWQFWWICPLMMLVMLAVFATIFLAVRRSSADGPQHWGPPWRMMGGDPSGSALQILNERFARGEIQREEYEQRKAVIFSAGQH